MALLTGSRAYGTPNEYSDIDIVILVDVDTIDHLCKTADEVDDNTSGDDDSCNASVRFGRLNLICVIEPKDYQIWEEGTKQLVLRKPVTRDEAVRLFDELFNPLNPTEEPT